MSNAILVTALNDFSLNSSEYLIFDRTELEKITDDVISDSSEKKTLEFSQQIILNNKKKSVSFSNNNSPDNDSPEYDEVINNEKKIQKQKKLMEYSPCLEYIDVCMAAAANKRRSKSKIECKKYLK